MNAPKYPNRKDGIYNINFDLLEFSLSETDISDLEKAGQCKLKPKKIEDLENAIETYIWLKHNSKNTPFRKQVYKELSSTQKSLGILLKFFGPIKNLAHDHAKGKLISSLWEIEKPLDLPQRYKKFQAAQTAKRELSDEEYIKLEKEHGVFFESEKRLDDIYVQLNFIKKALNNTFKCFDEECIENKGGPELNKVEDDLICDIDKVYCGSSGKKGAFPRFQNKVYLLIPDDIRPDTTKTYCAQQKQNSRSKKRQPNLLKSNNNRF